MLPVPLECVHPLREEISYARRVGPTWAPTASKQWT